jgi:hypothetical protein
MDDLAVIACDKKKALALGAPVYDLDLDFVNGAAAQLAAHDAELQRAYIACYLKLGSVPLQEDKGIDWAAFRNGKSTYNEIVCALNKNITTFIGAGKFAPVFSREDREMKFKLMRMQ